MAVDEQRRLELFRRLSTAIGEDATTTMFEMLPPPGSDVATKDDIADLRVEMNARFDQLVARYDGRFTQVDARFDQLVARYDGRFAQVDARFDQVDARFAQMNDRFTALEERIDLKFDSLRNELVAEFHAGLTRAVVGQTRIIVFSLIAALVAISGLAFGLG